MTNEERAKKLAIDIITANEDCSDAPVSDIPKIILAHDDEIRRECAESFRKVGCPLKSNPEENRPTSCQDCTKRFGPGYCDEVNTIMGKEAGE